MLMLGNLVDGLWEKIDKTILEQWKIAISIYLVIAIFYFLYVCLPDCLSLPWVCAYLSVKCHVSLSLLDLVNIEV
jgi:hypothetical protein